MGREGCGDERVDEGVDRGWTEVLLVVQIIAE